MTSTVTAKSTRRSSCSCSGEPAAATIAATIAAPSRQFIGYPHSLRSDLNEGTSKEQLKQLMGEMDTDQSGTIGQRACSVRCDGQGTKGGGGAQHLTACGREQILRSLAWPW
jgi:hypothetical protein